MPQPEGINILPGMTANVVVIRSAGVDRNDFIIIPTAAVFAGEAGASHVWVFNAETREVQRRKITTGGLTGTESIRVTVGLKAGETIAVAGVTRLREGMKVRPMDP